jgi:hypothetical protein
MLLRKVCILWFLVVTPIDCCSVLKILMEPTGDVIPIYDRGQDKMSSDYLEFTKRRENERGKSNHSFSSSDDEVPIIELADDDMLKAPIDDKYDESNDPPFRKYEKLRELLNKQFPDMQITTSTYDGNCFFSSIIKIMKLNMTAKELRTRVVNYICSDLFGIKDLSELTAELPLVKFGSRMLQVLRCVVNDPTTANIKAYLKQMAQNGVFIDVNVGCTATAAVIGRDIKSFYIEGRYPNEKIQTLEFKCPPPQGLTMQEADKNPVYISYTFRTILRR